MDLEAKAAQNSSTVVLLEEQRNQQARPKRLNFSNPSERAEHIRAFLAWLPQVLHAAPGIQWDRLPSKVMGYLIRTVADSPDAIPIAFAMGCAMDAMKGYSLAQRCWQLTGLFRQLRRQHGMKDLSELRTRQIWDRFVAGRKLSRNEVNFLQSYDSLAALHVRAYLERLNERQRIIWEHYALPPLPAGFFVKYGQRRVVEAATQQRRKEQSAVLVPLFPLLVELAQLRKQAAERLVKEFRRLRDRAMKGEIALPYHFEYRDRCLAVSEDASTLAEVKLIEREIILSLTLWDRVSWAKHHPERYGQTARWRAALQTGAYALERTSYFFQYEGNPGDLLWCGDLLAKRMIRRGAKGGPDYLFTSRPGLLNSPLSDGAWFTRAVASGGEVLFDPESLYRGTLFASTLATLALTNGSRVCELLQVSATRFETLIVDELKHQQPTGRKIGILVQKLLPKGVTQESERQFFLISEVAARLLREIGELLESRHGGTIPVVWPSHNSKAEDLQPEPYLFQWEASSDGRAGVLTEEDVGRLLRFLFHGLTLTTRTGTPIRVATHLLRHVLATHARHVEKVPAEAVAFLLHHRVTLEGSPHALSIPEATAYYSRMPVEQLLALLFDAQSRFTSSPLGSYLHVPPPGSVQEMDAALRRIFEQWSMLGPTVFGYCSAGLCVRPNNRALCLGCPYLVPHYSNLRSAKTWRKLYVLQAKLHDAHGHHIDAQQARQMIQYLDDIINLMQIQIKARQDGGFLPFADTLPPATDEEREEH